MSITFRCPGCGKSYELDDGLAGKKGKCKQCGQGMQIPAPSIAAAAPVSAIWSDAETGTESIRFRCQGCGKSYSTPTHLAGKKIVCKGCGQSVKIPGEPVESAGKPKSRSSLRIETDGPPPVDIFALDEPPAPTRRGPAGDGILADEPPKPARSASEAGDDAPLPPRAGYEPMTEAKKKKIEKRVKKVEKTKTSFAGAAYGVSFGTVLAVSLFTWRIYRTVNRIGRLAGSPDAVASAPVDLSPRALAAEMDKEIANQIRQPGTAEAGDWLDPAKHPNHAVMEMPIDRARAIVAGFYERGAEKVYVLDPTPLGNTIMTAQIAVKLPADPSQRKACLDWEIQSLTGGQPPQQPGDQSSQDLGQKYLMITTD